jgi:hypothetical protein
VDVRTRTLSDNFSDRNLTATVAEERGGGPASRPAIRTTALAVLADCLELRPLDEAQRSTPVSRSNRSTAYYREATSITADTASPRPGSNGALAWASGGELVHSFGGDVRGRLPGAGSLSAHGTRPSGTGQLWRRSAALSECV